MQGNRADRCNLVRAEDVMSRPVLVELARFECLSPQAACTAPLQGMQLDICQATTLLPSTAPCQLASSPYCLHFSLRHSMTHLLALCRGCHDGCSTSQLRAAGQEAPNIALRSLGPALQSSDKHASAQTCRLNLIYRWLNFGRSFQLEAFWPRPGVRMHVLARGSVHSRVLTPTLLVQARKSRPSHV